MIRWFSVPCFLIALMLAVAGCGSSEAGDSARGQSTTSTATSDDSPPSSDRPKKGAWGVAFGAQGDELGIILYDLSGHTLYTFDKDNGGTSSCYGACAKRWTPALTEGKPRAGGAAVAAKVGATKRKDGTRQLTYAGHPLYTYKGEGQGKTNGNDVSAFGGEWYAIRPNGEKP